MKLKKILGAILIAIPFVIVAFGIGGLTGLLVLSASAILCAIFLGGLFLLGYFNL